jgi:hypothetical protein
VLPTSCSATAKTEISFQAMDPEPEQAKAALTTPYLSTEDNNSTMDT